MCVDCLFHPDRPEDSLEWVENLKILKIWERDDGTYDFIYAKSLSVFQNPTYKGADENDTISGEIHVPKA